MWFIAVALNCWRLIASGKLQTLNFPSLKKGGCALTFELCGMSSATTVSTSEVANWLLAICNQADISHCWQRVDRHHQKAITIATFALASRSNAFCVLAAALCYCNHFFWHRVCTNTVRSDKLSQTNIYHYISYQSPFKPAGTFREKVNGGLSPGYLRKRHQLLSVPLHRFCALAT